jgi:hypothetical protein
MFQPSTGVGYAQKRTERKGVSKGLGIENQLDSAIKIRVKSAIIYNFLTEIFHPKFSKNFEWAEMSVNTEFEEDMP